MIEPSRTEIHNELGRTFVSVVGRNTSNPAELMVVLESALLATMLLLNRAHGVSPAASVEFIELAIHRATERFTKGLSK